MQTTQRARNLVATLSIVAVAAVLIGATAWHPAKEIPAALPVATTAISSPMVGVATGEFQNGVPVYRLPSVAVTVSRSEELAKMAREESLAARQTGLFQRPAL